MGYALCIRWTSNMKDNDTELCPCESGKLYSECCKKVYDQENAKQAIKDALSDPEKAKELKALLQKSQNKL